MTTVYQELLPESYLLILAPGGPDGAEVALADSLHCAQHSGRPAVWVDCSLLNHLSKEAAQMLCAINHELSKHHTELVLVHVPERVKNELLDQASGPPLCIVATLLDAAQHTREFTRHLAA
jgi:anti-anti-sigma regulatory factor